MDLLCFSCLTNVCLLCLCARLFICALWSPLQKGLTNWLSFLVSNCEFVTFTLVSWVRCGTCLYRFLIFAPLLTLYYCFKMVFSFHVKLITFATEVPVYKDLSFRHIHRLTCVSILSASAHTCIKCITA